MIVSLQHQGKAYTIDTSHFIDLSIPYHFNGPQPNFYDVNPGKLIPLKVGEKSYSVRDGAGCNVPEISMNIHCTGTHTECVGHLLEENSSVTECIEDLFFPAVLITIQPILFSACHDRYHVDVQGDEQVINRESLEKAFQQFQDYYPSSLIIRTLPNFEKKQFYRYTEQISTFFTHDAVAFLSSQEIQHLVVDIPSLDRMEDDGILGNHRIFWGNGKDFKGDVDPNSHRTITELAYIPEDVKDGFYFLEIQLPHFQCDAAPSRPILIKPV